jgi:hypothetical protein
MYNTTELKKRIADAKKELEAMETLWNESSWKPEYIYSGLQVEGKNMRGETRRCVVIHTGYDETKEMYVFRLYGNGSLFDVYGDHPRTAQEMADYFNEKEKTKLEDISSNFKLFTEKEDN